MKPNQNALQLMRATYRGGNFGYYWRADNKQTTWFDCKDPAGLPTGENIYFGVHPTTKRKAGRGTTETVQLINCLFAEFDAKDFDNDKDKALNHILDLELNPSALIDSGGGFHGYWFLAEPVQLDDDNREEIRELQARFVETMGGDPGAKDLARVLRVPGTYNTKYNPARLVDRVWIDPENTFTLTELENLTKLNIDAEKPAPRLSSIFSADNWPESLEFWTTKALERARPGNRDNTGFWLASQLRDAGLTIDQAMSSDYPDKVPQSKDKYTRKDYERTVKSAYSNKRREPARSTSSRQNNNNEVVPGMKIKQAIEKPKPEAPAPDFTLKIAKDAQARNERGDAEIFEMLFEDRAIFDHALNGWFLWTGHYWEPDKTKLTQDWVMNEVSRFYFNAAEVGLENQDKEAVKLFKRAFDLRSKKRSENALAVASILSNMKLTGSEWDAEKWILGTENGVIDLRTGEHRPGRPSDFIRAHTPIDWMGLDAQAPRWERFLLEIFDDDQSMVDFIQRLLGYGITGSTEEHILPILYGPDGRNGKSTLLETLGSVLGPDLATSSQADAIMETGARGDSPRPFVYALQGKRLVWTSESNEGRRLNAGLVKQLTGGDRLNVRTLHSKPVEFLPSHLLILITNHRPHISADDAAIWDRVFLIPFNQRFVDDPKKHNEKPAEKNLKDKLEAEAPGILAWLVRGCLKWQEIGLQAPEKVRAATEEYKLEEDTIGQFILECCEVGPGLSARGSLLYDAYKTWATDNGDKPMSKNAFGQRMKKRFELVAPKNFVNYGGIGIKA